MSTQYGSQGMVGSLRRVFMCRPGSSVTRAVASERHYRTGFDGFLAARHAQAFGAPLAAMGADIVWYADAMLTNDPSPVTDYGASLLCKGNATRVPETAPRGTIHADHGIPILERIEAPGTVEGEAICIAREGEPTCFSRLILEDAA
ncbi:MAG: hypothetical protein AAFQ51_14530 [Pseudomonadota bacterium]